MKALVLIITSILLLIIIIIYNIINKKIKKIKNELHPDIFITIDIKNGKLFINKKYTDISKTILKSYDEINILINPNDHSVKGFLSSCDDFEDE